MNDDQSPMRATRPSAMRDLAFGASEVAPLGSVSVIAGGVTLGRSFSGSSSIELPYLRVANVQDGFIDTSEMKTVRILRTELERYRLHSGDVLMTEGGDFDKLGRGAVWDGSIDPCLHQNHIFRVRCNPSVLLPEYLAAYSASSAGRRFFLSLSKRTTNLASINLTQLKAFPLPIPPLQEQRRITEVLGSADAAIRSTEQAIIKLELARQGLLCDVMTRGIDERGQVRGSRQSASASINLPFEPLPDGWRFVATEDLFEIQLGKMLDTKSFGAGPRYRYLTNRNVQWGRFILDDLEEMPFGESDVQKFALRDGDVLVCEGGEVGRCAVWRNAGLGIFYQKALHRLRSRGEIFPDFFVLYMAWLAAHHGFARFVGQTSIAHLPREKLAIVPVRVPSAAEQKRILSAVSAYDDLTAVERQRITKLRNVKRGIMDDLLTGRIGALG